MDFVAVAILSAIVLGHPFTTMSSFDWFKMHSPLLKYSSGQIAKRCSKYRKSLFIYIAAAMLVGKKMPTSPFLHKT